MTPLKTWKTPSGPHILASFQNLDEQLRLLRSFIEDYRQAPSVRDLAVELARQCEPRDKKAQALAVANWVKENIYYVHELPERFQTPIVTLEKRAGDCDDHTALIGAMIESIGIKCAMVVMNIDGRWRHIFPAAILPKTRKFLPLDSTTKVARVEDMNPVTFAIQKGKRVRLKVA